MNDSKQGGESVTIHLAGPGAHLVSGTAHATPPTPLNLWAAHNCGAVTVWPSVARGVEWGGKP